MKKSVRETIFFILVFLMFFLGAKLSEMWVQKANMKADNAYLAVGVIFAMAVAAVFFLAKLNKCNSNEGFWDVSQYAKCKGGPYMWQGDDPDAEMCRELAKTSEGRCGIASYNCPKGYNGQPNLPTIYTPVSDDNWANERCTNGTCGGCPYDEGLCSMQAHEKP
jgi:hypothetical protein